MSERRRGKTSRACSPSKSGRTGCCLSARFEHRQDVPRRVREPGDVRSRAAEDALFVGVEALVALESDSSRGEIIHRGVDRFYLEVQDGEGGRHVVRFRVDEDFRSAGDAQPQQAIVLRYVDSESPFVKGPRLFDVVHRKAAESLGRREHDPSLVDQTVLVRKDDHRPPFVTKSVRMDAKWTPTPGSIAVSFRTRIKVGKKRRRRRRSSQWN